MTREASRRCSRYRWPGNVRELRNVLERAAIVCEGGLIAPGAPGAPAGRAAAAPGTTNVKDVERQMIEQVLRESGGNKSKAARRLGLTRKELYGRLKHSTRSTADQDRFLPVVESLRAPKLDYVPRRNWGCIYNPDIHGPSVVTPSSAPERGPSGGRR